MLRGIRSSPTQQQKTKRNTVTLVIFGLIALITLYFFFSSSSPSSPSSPSSFNQEELGKKAASKIKHDLQKLKSQRPSLSDSNSNLASDSSDSSDSSSSSSSSSSLNEGEDSIEAIRAKRRGEIRGKPNSEMFHGDMVGHRLDQKRSAGFQTVPYISVEEETVEQKQRAHAGNNFNLARSNSLSLNRDIPDVRSPSCLEYGKKLSQLLYSSSSSFSSSSVASSSSSHIRSIGDLPNTSVIFIFFNEPASTLYRSIHSILNRSPPELLHEIILVDDGSEVEWLKEGLDEYVKLLPKTKLLRLGRRHGLMVARLKGAQIATGDTLTFLDSHIEANRMWLEPLMYRIAEDRKHVVMPVIDSIDGDSFNVTPAGIDILGFTWSLGQQGLFRPRTANSTAPMPSPIMAGGLFSIDRQFFFEIGGYDAHMKQYGGEEMDISFRIWLCGGTLECHPCSHVGHIFRMSTYWAGRAYPVDGSNVVNNKLRTAYIWMDEYKDIFIESSGRANDKNLLSHIGPLDDMLAVKERLKCKPFSWYLKNVFPELFDPFDRSGYFFLGTIRNTVTGDCITAPNALDNGQNVILSPCGTSKSQQIFLTNHNEARFTGRSFEFCLDSANRADGTLAIWTCHRTGGNQQFSYNPDSTISRGRSCLTAASDRTLRFYPCSGEPNQKWILAP